MRITVAIATASIGQIDIRTIDIGHIQISRVLVKRRPAPKVFRRKINTGILNAGLGYKLLWQIISDLKILQTDISHILKIPCLHGTLHRTVIAGIARQISIRILFSPVIILMPSGHVVVRTVILSPEYTF